jgi:hypothetical protein
MNALRFSTTMPGVSASTTNAVMPPAWPSLWGTRAITTSRPAMTPLVVHSLVPLSTYSLPSGLAVVRSRAGSLPTSGSVSKNALISRVHLGSHVRFCSSVPNIEIGCATPIDWCAESNPASEEFTEPTSSSALW